MRNIDTFVIESEPFRHRLALNGQELGTFYTLAAAETAAAGLAQRTIPGAKLRFELDFKWILWGLEIRVATMETESDSQRRHGDRSAGGRGSACGS